MPPLSKDSSENRNPKLEKCSEWAKKVEAAFESDTWGQVLDAADQYETVIKQIAKAVSSGDASSASRAVSSANRRGSVVVSFDSFGADSLLDDIPTQSDNSKQSWSPEESTLLTNIVCCLKERVEVIQSPISRESQFPKENIKKLIKPLRSLTINAPLPQVATTNNNNLLTNMQPGKIVEMDAVQDLNSERLQEMNLSDSEDDVSVEGGDSLRSGSGRGSRGAGNTSRIEAITNTVVAVSNPGSLLPQIKKKEGETLLEIKILKIGLKDAASIRESFFTVSVKDGIGMDVTDIQVTPSCGIREGKYIEFNTPVHIQKPLEKLPKRYAIFFELKHTKGQYVWVKCWSFVESDELSKNGEIVCEIYKKPTDFKRKKLSLKTKKELFLHLQVTLHL